MRRFWVIFLVIVGFVCAGRSTPAAAGVAAGDSLIEVATSTRQWTGIAVSRSGRVFVNFPRWSANVPVSVGELKKDGTVDPYPNRELNRWKTGDDPAQKFVCVQSVYVDANNRLWILDPANPLFGGVVEGGAKLIRVDLASNTTVKTYHFDPETAPRKSYLNDVRVETKTGTAYMTDSGLGAIVVLDLETGDTRRLLDDDPSTGAEKVQITIDGKPIPVVVHSDGIALDDRGGWLYY
ncbi:MAG: L-dopachrome tautomerase-related protein [bacterium]